jgi:hypothetical protein
MARRPDRTRRTDAQRRARDARAQRESAWQARQTQLEAALTDYFAAAAAAERIRAVAQAKADAVLASAEIAVSRPYAQACAAILRLRQLVHTNAELAGLCGIRPEEVSEMLAWTRQHAQEPAQAADGTAGLEGTANGQAPALDGGTLTEIAAGTQDDGGLAAGDDAGRSA